MRPVSDRFLDAVKGSHKIAVRALALEPGQSGTQPDGIELAVISGKIKFDYGAAVRAMLDLTIVPTATVGFPTRATNPIDVSGKEIIVYRGIDYRGGATDIVRPACFRAGASARDL